MTRSRDYYYDDEPADYDHDRPSDDHYDRGHRPRDDHYDRPRRHETRNRDPTNKPRRHPKSSRLKSAVDITIRVLILIFLLAFFTLPQFEPYRNNFLDYLEEGLYHYKEIPDYMIFQIERDMVIETSDDTAVTSFTLTIERPLELVDENDNKVQEMQEFTTVVPEDKEITEDLGRVISWEGVVPHGDKVEIKVFYTIKSAHIIWDISREDSGDLKDIPSELKNRYTLDDWLIKDYGTDQPVQNPYNTSEKAFYRINPSDPDIKALAERLKGSDTNVIKIVQSFYDYLDDGKGDEAFSRPEGCAYPDQFQMEQSRQTWDGMPKPARATLEDWVGDCDDQSFLLMSLCRAVGIPARVEAGGLWDSMAGAWGGHGWAQVYIPVNDGEDAWVTIDVVNNLFLDRDPFRFADFQGTGVPGVLENYYTSWVYSTDGGSNVFISEEYMDLNHVAIAGETVVHV